MPRKIRFPPNRYKKNLASLKIPSPIPFPHHFSNGPSLSQRKERRVLIQTTQRQAPTV